MLLCVYVAATWLKNAVGFALPLNIMQRRTVLVLQTLDILGTVCDLVKHNQTHMIGLLVHHCAAAICGS